MGTTHDITKNLGGDRLGSGNKNNVTMHNYNRSNHDLSYAWRSTMNVGTLVPFMKLLEETGDGFSINLKTVAKTIPTIGPLYGAFKLQLDVFECPIRLYNGLLHNNMTKVGMNMKQVKLPKMILRAKTNISDYDDFHSDIQISNSALLKYLGISGIGDTRQGYTERDYCERKFNAVPVLAYWDIYKNYYANKQEEKGAMITPHIENELIELVQMKKGDVIYPFTPAGNSTIPAGVTNPTDGYQAIERGITEIEADEEFLFNSDATITINVTGNNIEEFLRNLTGLWFVVQDGESDPEVVSMTDVYTGQGSLTEDSQGRLVLELKTPNSDYYTYKLIGVCYKNVYKDNVTMDITTFDLANIDNARIQILKKTGLSQELVLNTDCDFLPYKPIVYMDGGNRLWSKYEQNGLGLKTYQSDLLQNWLSTEWIDGENGINAITAIDTSSGSFQIDALNLANKVYNMLNRIAVSGGTYEDWQEAVFTANVNRRAETPVYKGGLACEIVFDEVVATAATESTPLGTLAGHAVIPKEGIRGGQIEITCNEPSYIIGIVSITPRIDYSQGNDWDMVELDTMDDLHKPALDGIGFEDLLQERAAWFGTIWDETNDAWIKNAMGKTPAWINYMTNINHSYGGFADDKEGGQMFMTLNRRYEIDEDNVTGIKDLTTYIDPRKYNYAFADNSLNAQNFWIQIGCEVKARRVMSAKILPNL